MRSIQEHDAQQHSRWKPGWECQLRCLLSFMNLGKLLNLPFYLLFDLFNGQYIHLTQNAQVLKATQ